MMTGIHRSNFLVNRNRSAIVLIICMARGRGLLQFFPRCSAVAIDEHLEKCQEMEAREVEIDEGRASALHQGRIERLIQANLVHAFERKGIQLVV